MKRTLIRALGIAATMGVVLGTTPAATANASAITLMWVENKGLCETLIIADCVVAEDGWTLAILDPAVTLFNVEDCIDLPRDHGRFVALVADAQDEHRFPSAIEELGTGTCESGTLDENDKVGGGEDWTLVDPIEGTLRHFSTGSWTEEVTAFHPGRGACGQTNKDTDLVFALPASQFDPSPGGNPNHNKNCGRRARVTSGEAARTDRSVVVTVVDRCAGCAYGDIDLSPAAFNQIADPDEGRVRVTWQFIS